MYQIQKKVLAALHHLCEMSRCVQTIRTDRTALQLFNERGKTCLLISRGCGVVVWGLRGLSLLILDQIKIWNV